MLSELPQSVVPGQLAGLAARIEGQLKLRTLPRLVAMLEEPCGTVQVALAFDYDERGFIHVTGRYETALRLLCQRCLEPFTFKLARPVDVGATSDRRLLRKLPDSLEPMLLTQESVALAEFIEDEILLGLPMAPMHNAGMCAVDGRPDAVEKPGGNPFGALAALRNRVTGD